MPTIQNGVDVEALTATIGALTEKPEDARVTFSATTKWFGGARSNTEIERLRVEQPDKPGESAPYVVHSDEPTVLLGTNTAPNPVELVLSALTSCLAVGYVYNAAARGIKIVDLEFSIEGDLDLHGFLGMKEDVRAGYDGVQVVAHISADAPEEQLRELSAHVQRTSPVLDILTNSVPVTVELAA